MPSELTRAGTSTRIGEAGRGLARTFVGHTALVLVPAGMLVASTARPGVSSVAITFAAIAGLAIWLMLSRPSLTDATFVFMALFLTYQVALPALYVTGVVFEGGSFSSAAMSSRCWAC